MMNYIFNTLKIFILLTFCGLLISCGGPKDTVPTNAVNDSVNDLEDSDLIYTGSLSGENGYTVSGDIEVYYTLATDTYSVILVNFLSSNGPDLKVYISQGIGVSNFENLGDLKSTNGSALRYDFAASRFDPAFDHILIWCQQFSVNFGKAQLVTP